MEEIITEFKTTVKLEDYIGYTIKSNSRKFAIGVSDTQSCCEEVKTTYHGDVEDLVDSTLLSCTTPDTVPDDVLRESNLDGREIYFVTLLLTFQKNNKEKSIYFFVANSHNGYYSHHAYVEVDGVNVISKYI
jgi:hypothetical protein